MTVLFLHTAIGTVIGWGIFTFVMKICNGHYWTLWSLDSTVRDHRRYTLAYHALSRAVQLPRHIEPTEWFDYAVSDVLVRGNPKIANALRELGAVFDERSESWRGTVRFAPSQLAYYPPYVGGAL